MKSKAKVLYRIGKKTVQKGVRGDFKYRGENINKVAVRATKSVLKTHPKKTLQNLKKEIRRVNRNLEKTLKFPNGLVSGVNKGKIEGWYKEKGRAVTLVIPSYNDLDVLIPCLESIKKTTTAKMAKVIVVDDYCQPENSKKLKELENEQVKVIFREKNGGFAKAVNTGLKAADKNHDVVLVNSDILAHEGWLGALQYGAYKFGVDTGIVGPKLLYPDGRIQSAGSFRNTEAPEWFDHYYRFQDSNYGPANVPQYCIGVTGACMYIKREFINYVGMLDDNYNFAFEDIDLCLRGWEAGYRTLYFPAATLTHVESATRHKNKTISAKEKQSLDYFWEKWKKWFDDRNVLDKDGKIKIIFVLQTIGLSGGIKIVLEHASKLPKDKFNVEVWSLDSKGSVNQPWEVSEEVKLKSFKNYYRLSAALTNEEAIKVATWWETAFPVWLASIKKGIPVYFIQEIESWFYPNDVIKQSSVISCYRKEFKNLTTSQYNLEEINQLGLKATKIPCGYDEKVYYPIPKSQRVGNELLAVGRKFFQKNFDFTFRGWKAMGDSRPDFKLFGFEPELSKLDKKISYIKNPSDEEVNSLYNEATIFVQTSRHEGFSLPLLEAMATGAPIICTDAHGNRDFCKDGENCIVVEQDNVDELKGALIKLFKNKKLRDKIGKSAENTAKNYTWPVVMKEITKFYEDVAKK